MVAARGIGGSGEGNGELVFDGYRLSVCKMKKLWKEMVVMDPQQCECT